MKKRLTYILSPAMVLLLLAIIFWQNNLFPLFSKTLSWCDMSQQVIPLLSDFKDILAGKSSMLLNMNNAGGMDFIGVFFFFLASPFTFLVAFIPKQDLILFANILVVLKLMVCSVTASIFFKSQFNKLSNGTNVALSVMYALSGYAMYYYQNVVWLDMMYLFPLLLLSLKAICEKKKLWPYTLCFTAVLIVNYYLSYMVVIFIILAFFAYIHFCCDKTHKKENVLRLCLGTGFALMMTAAVWLPALLQYLESARSTSVFTNLQIYNIFYALSTKVPLLFCTACLIPVLFFFFKSYKVDKGHKIFLLVMFGLTVIPLFIEPVNIMWHTGSYQGFPMRYGYMPTFLLLIMAAYVLNEENDVISSDRTAVFMSVAGIAACIVFQFFWFQDNQYGLTAYYRTLWGNDSSLELLFGSFAVFTGIYFIVFFLYRNLRLTKRIFTVFLLVILSVECIFNGNVYIGAAANYPNDYKYAMQLSGKIQDSGFYRVKVDKKYFPSNMVGAMGYASLGHYTSLTNRDYESAMRKFGYSSYWMEVNSAGGTVFSDGLLCNKYIISQNENSVYSDTPALQQNPYTVYKNPYYMPLGIVTDSDLSKKVSLPDKMRMDLQQYVYENLFQSKNKLVQKYTPELKEGVDIITQPNSVNIQLKEDTTQGLVQYVVDVEDEQILYFDCFKDMGATFGDPILSSVSVMVNGETVAYEYPEQAENGILELGKFKNQMVIIDVDINKNLSAQSFGVWGMHTNRLSGLSQNAAGLITEGNTIKGKATAEADGQYLFVAVPDLNGFSAKVNGKIAKIYKTFDTFMAVKLQKGENTVELTYVSPGVICGVVISILGILAFLLAAWASRRGWYKKIAFLETPAYALFSFLVVVVALCVYILPVIINLFFGGA